VGIAIPAFFFRRFRVLLSSFPHLFFRRSRAVLSSFPRRSFVIPAFIFSSFPHLFFRRFRIYFFVVSAFIFSSFPRRREPRGFGTRVMAFLDSRFHGNDRGYLCLGW
jgi:hypothetical protein